MVPKMAMMTMENKMKFCFFEPAKFFEQKKENIHIKMSIKALDADTRQRVRTASIVASLAAAVKELVRRKVLLLILRLRWTQCLLD